MTAVAFVLLPLTLLQAQALTLAEAERRAVAHQPALMQAEHAAAAGEARALGSRAALLPQVVATGTYKASTANRTIRIGTQPYFAALRPSPNHSLYDYLNTGLTATQLLYDFGSSTGAWRASRELALAGREDQRAARVDVLLDVRVSFFRAKAAKQIVEVARESLENQRRHLREVEGFVEVKLRPSIDLAQARADVGAAELRLLLAENDLALAKADLGRAMGEEATPDYDLAPDEIPAVAGEAEPQADLAKRALQRRPDIASLGHRIHADEHALAAARGGYGPALHLVAAFTDAGPMFVPGPFEGAYLHWNYYGALTFTWPVFEGLRTKSRVRESQATLDQDRAHRESVALGARVEVENAWRTIGAAKAAIEVADRAAESASARLSLAEARYQEAVGTALELGDAQLGDVTAKLECVRARFALSIARAQLLHALGSTEAAGKE